MDVLSTCPMTVASVTWQPRPNTWVLTVVCKATFALEPVECPLTDAQEAPFTEDVHWHHDPSRSLAVATDLAPLKPRAEVLLVGHAYAPQRSPVRSLVARLVVGEIDKTVEVLCDRFVGGDGAVAEQAPFVKMPLVYERAAGGRGTWNPAGVRPDARDTYGRVVLPNLQPPGAAARSSSEGIARVGFGPIAPDWPLRRDKLGRHAATWSARNLAREPLPQDIDPGYFNAAPPDQQIPALRGDESLVLENLHPEHRRVTTRLPGLVPDAVVQSAGGSQPLSMRCDTLWIDTDRARVMLTFRGQLTMERPDAAGRVVVSMRRPRPISTPPDSEATRTVSPDLLRQRESALPFEPRATPAEGRAPASNEGLPFGALPPPLPPPPVGSLTTVALRPPVPPPAAPSFGAPPPLPVAPPPLPPLPVPPPRIQAPSTRSSAPPPPAVEQAPAPRKAEEKAVATEGKAALEEGEGIELLWFEPESVPRIRRRKAWRAILDALEQTPIDPELDDPELSRSPAEAENRRDLSEVLGRGEALGAEGLREALKGGFRRGTFVPKVELFAGELFFPFDELGVLRATMITVTPLIAGDEALRATVEAANEFLRIPGLFSAPAVAEGLTTRIRDTFMKGKRMVPPGYLDAQVERAALEQRLYQKRTVFGGVQLRALLEVKGSGGTGVPVYLPEGLARGLPMFQRFRVRVLGEVHMRVDAYEGHEAAVRALSLGRVAVRG